MPTLPLNPRRLPHRPSSHLDPGRAWLNLALALLQVAAIAWQAQGGAGADLGQRGSDPPVVPALYTFAIWGPIYLGSLAYAVYGLLPGQAGRQLHRKVGWWTAGAFLASTLWALAAGFPAPWVTWGTVVCIFGLFAGLLGAYLNASRLATAGWC